MAHMRMMGEENSRLMIENSKLKQEVVNVGEDWDKKMKTTNQSLEKERAKNKMLMMRLKENESNNNNDNIREAVDNIGVIWADENQQPNRTRQRSASQGARSAAPPPKSSISRARSRSNSSISISSISSLMSASLNSSNRAGTPSPLVGGEEGKINLLTKKIRVYR